jgi:hypothetical protein
VSTAVIIRPAPAVVIPNGLAWKPYVYQGTGEDTRTAWMDELDSDPYGDFPPAPRELRPHGTGAAERRHYRKKTPLCEACEQYKRRRLADRAAADVASGKTVRAVHAANGGRPWCGAMPAIGDPVIAAPGQTVTCRRCTKAMGRKS